MNESPTINCPQCGTPSRPGQKFCALCGAPLTLNTTAPSAANLSATHHTPTSPSTIPPFAPYVSADALTHQAQTEDSQAYSQYTLQPPYSAPLPTAQRRPAMILTLGAGVLLLAIIAVVVILLTRTGIVDPGPRDAETALKSATTVMSAVKTFHYSSEVGFFGIDTGATGITDSVPLTITLSGNVSMPSSFTLDANISQLGHYITIGEDTWKRQSGGDPWTQQSTADASLGLINPLSFTSYLSYYMSGTVQTINFGNSADDYTQRVRFKVDADRMASAITDTGISQILATTRAINVDAWLDKEDHIRRMTLSVDMQSGAGVILRTTFSNYNGTVNIHPPQ